MEDVVGCDRDRCGHHVLPGGLCVECARGSLLSHRAQPGRGRGLTFEVTAGGPFGYLMAGFVIKALSLGVAIALMWIMLNRIKRGQLYSESTARLAGGTSGAMLAWLLGNFVENMGNNFAASRLGIGDQWSGPLLTNISVMVIVFLLIAMLYVLQQAIRNALGMQEDIDGLV